MNINQTNSSSNILDESIFSTPHSPTASELILMGILSYISITSTLWTIDMLMKDLFIYFNMIPILNFWIREIIYLGLFVVVHLLFLKKFRKNSIRKNQVKKYVRWLIVFLILTQIFQMVYTFYQFDIFPDPYMDHLEYYFEEKRKNELTIGLVGPIFTYCKYLFIIICIFHQQNKDKT